MKLPPNCQKWKISFSYSFFALSMSYWAYMPKMLFVDRMGWLEANTKTKSKNSEQKWKKNMTEAVLSGTFQFLASAHHQGAVQLLWIQILSLLPCLYTCTKGHRFTLVHMYWPRTSLHRDLRARAILGQFFPTVLEPTFFVMES